MKTFTCLGLIFAALVCRASAADYRDGAPCGCYTGMIRVDTICLFPNPMIGPSVSRPASKECVYLHFPRH